MAAPLAIDVDRSSPVPLYFQVARQIEAAIASGDLAAGARLENEIELADRLGLSRPTMRRAIQELVAKGMLVRKRGVGTQVVQSQVQRPVELSSLYDDLAKTGQNPSTHVISCATVPADETVAAALGLPQDTPVVAIERLRSARGEPLALLANWVPVDLGDMTTELLTEYGLYDLMRRYNVNLRIANQRIGATTADTAQARLLHVRRGSALVTMERTSYDDTGRAVELGRHVYRADGYAFEITVVGR